MQNWELSKDGKIVNYDMSQMIEKEAFCCLKEIEIFLDRCTVMNDTLAWDISGNWDAVTGSFTTTLSKMAGIAE